MAENDLSLEPYFTVRLFAWLRDLFGHKELHVPLEQAPDIERLLQHLCAGVEADSSCSLMQADGHAGEGFIVLLNGRSIQFSGGLRARLMAGDVVAIFPPVAGG